MIPAHSERPRVTEHVRTKRPSKEALRRLLGQGASAAVAQLVHEGLKDRAQAVRYAFGEGLVPPPRG